MNKSLDTTPGTLWKVYQAIDFEDRKDSHFTAQEMLEDWIIRKRQNTAPGFIRFNLAKVGDILMILDSAGDNKWSVFKFLHGENITWFLGVKPLDVMLPLLEHHFEQLSP